MAKTILTPAQKQLLAFLAKDFLVKKHFYLTGGTALAAYYLYHRISEDLDFFSQKEIDTIWLTTLTNRVKKELKATKVDIQQSFNRNMVFFSLGKDVIKTEFTYFPFPQVEKPKAKEGIAIDSLKDIAVNKLFTIYQNPSARHFIDLYLILKNKKATWNELKKLARIKFDVVIDPMQLGSQLATAIDIKDIPKILINLPQKEWRSFFIEKARELKEEIEK